MEPPSIDNQPPSLKVEVEQVSVRHRLILLLLVTVSSKMMDPNQPTTWDLYGGTTVHRTNFVYMCVLDQIHVW